MAPHNDLQPTANPSLSSKLTADSLTGLGCLAAVILKPDTFEGLRFDFTRPLNQNFAICHSMFAGNVEVPTNNAQVIKMPMGTYEFGANLVSNRVRNTAMWHMKYGHGLCHAPAKEEPTVPCTSPLIIHTGKLAVKRYALCMQGNMMVGRILTDGRMTGRVK